MRLAIYILAGLAILLQIALWSGNGSLRQVYSLRKEVALQEEKVAQLKQRNQTLEAEVQDLKHRLDALEELARTDLGMIHHGETFYQYSIDHE
ncbi:MAG: septum formation initiator family protein [Candidatus Berkiellales bacterium]